MSQQTLLEEAEAATRESPVEIGREDIDSTFTVTGPEGDTHRVSIEGDPTDGEVAAIAATVSAVIDTPQGDADGGIDEETGTDPWKAVGRHRQADRRVDHTSTDGWKLSGRPGTC